MGSFDAAWGMIVHPEIAVVEREVGGLRVSLAEAIRKLTYMEEVEGPYLRLLYVQQLGGVQVEVMELQADVAVLRRQIDAITARLNRGEVVTVEWLDALEAKVSLDIQGLLDEILRRKNECREADELLEGFGTIDRVGEGRLKAIYRDLCRALHPDMGLADEAVFEVWWDEIQSAYARGDLEQLESIALALDVRGLGEAEGGVGVVVGDGSRGVRGESTVVERRKSVVVQGNLEVLVRERDRLRDCLEGYLGKRKTLQTQPPFSYAEQLHDSALMAERREEFAMQARGLEGRKSGLEEHLADLLKAFRIGESSTSDQGPAE